MKIHIIGAAGTGTSTIGKHISEKFGYKQIESDFFAWKHTDPPFSEYQDETLSNLLLKQVFESEDNFVLSGSVARWGDEFAKRFDLVIFLTAPTRVRIRRLRQREKELYGKRIEKGGDMHQNFVNFLWYAKNYFVGDLSFRSYALHKKFISEHISCPVLKVSTNKNLDEVFKKIDAKIFEIKKMQN